MPVSCHFQGCKALLRTVKRRYIKYHTFAFFCFAFLSLHGRSSDSFFVTSYPKSAIAVILSDPMYH